MDVVRKKSGVRAALTIDGGVVYRMENVCSKCRSLVVETGAGDGAFLCGRSGEENAVTIREYASFGNSPPHFPEDWSNRPVWDDCDMLKKYEIANRIREL